MSLIGKQDKNDPRNTLIVKAIEAIEKLDPKYVIIENVPPMLKAYISYKEKKINILLIIFIKYFIIIFYICIKTRL